MPNALADYRKHDHQLCSSILSPSPFLSSSRSHLFDSSSFLSFHLKALPTSVFDIVALNSADVPRKWRSPAQSVTRFFRGHGPAKKGSTSGARLRVVSTSWNKPSRSAGAYFLNRYGWLKQRVVARETLKSTMRLRSGETKRFEAQEQVDAFLCHLHYCAEFCPSAS